MDLELWKKVKKDKKLTIKQIAEKANLPIGSVQNIFCGYVPNPRIDTVKAIEQALEINDEDMIKYIGGFSIPEDKYAIPLVGDVVAGVPVETSEYLEGYVYVGYKNPEEYFALKVHGDSMINAGITPKSILIVHKQNYADCGDIIVAAVDGKSTVKRYKDIGGVKLLFPENSNYEPIPITNNVSFYIFGKVVQIRTDL